MSFGLVAGRGGRLVVWLVAAWTVVTAGFAVTPPTGFLVTLGLLGPRLTLRLWFLGIAPLGLAILLPLRAFLVLLPLLAALGFSTLWLPLPGLGILGLAIARAILFFRSD